MILLLNPNSSEATTAAMVRIASRAAPALAISGRTAPFGPAMLVEPEALENSAAAVVAMAREPAAGYITAAFGDPGLDALRGATDVPVVGIGEASFLEAATYGRFGIATTTPTLEQAIAARVSASGLTGFTGCRFTSGDPRSLALEPEMLVEALSGAIEACLGDGAQAVIIGGGPLAEAAEVLAPRFDVPIIQPVPAAARLMARLISG